MQNEHLKVQHIIVLTALFVSLLGSLLALDKMNDAAMPLTGATASVDVRQMPEETVVRIIDESDKDDQEKSRSLYIVEDTEN